MREVRVANMKLNGSNINHYHRLFFGLRHTCFWFGHRHKNTRSYCALKLALYQMTISRETWVSKRFLVQYKMQIRDAKYDLEPAFLKALIERNWVSKTNTIFSSHYLIALLHYKYILIIRLCRFKRSFISKYNWVTEGHYHRWRMRYLFLVFQTRNG